MKISIPKKKEYKKTTQGKQYLAPLSYNYDCLVFGSFIFIFFYRFCFVSFVCSFRFVLFCFVSFCFVLLIVWLIVFVYMYVCMYVCIDGFLINVFERSRTWDENRRKKLGNIYIYIYIYIFVRTHTHRYAHTNTHTYAHSYTHTHTNTHIHR